MRVDESSGKSTIRAAHQPLKAKAEWGPSWPPVYKMRHGDGATQPSGRRTIDNLSDKRAEFFYERQRFFGSWDWSLKNCVPKHPHD